MNRHLVLTITCPDRPGIVERVTEVTVAQGANWEASRMARLGGEFVGMVMISVAQERAATLAEALRQLASEQMTAIVKFTDPPADAAHGTLYALHLRGADHEGIVHKVAAYLAHHGMNVEEMETQIVAAPTTASPLFQMEAQIRVPGEVPPADLQASLDRIGEELGVDIDIEAVS